MTIIKLCMGFLIPLITFISFGQTNTMIVSSNVILPKDAIVKKQLLRSINNFLNQIIKPNRENTFVQNAYLLETSALLDEMKDLGKSSKFKDENFYKPYLTNATQLNDSNFLIQLSYCKIRLN